MKRAVVLLWAAAWLPGAWGQAIEVYSEFQPFGAPPREGYREIISPAVARNGYATFHVAVTAGAGKSFFLFCQTNPPGIADARLYKVLPAGRLEPVRSPNFGVISDEGTPREYVLDIWIPREAEPGRRVRLELQLKMGDWVVYPLELRIQKATVPEREAPGAVPETLEGLTERNRRQDEAFERSMGLPEVLLLTAEHMANGWKANSPFAMDDTEWYLRVRDVMYHRANAH